MLPFSFSPWHRETFRFSIRWGQTQTRYTVLILPFGNFTFSKIFLAVLLAQSERVFRSDKWESEKRTATGALFIIGRSFSQLTEDNFAELKDPLID
jgi:hypothetical protein